MSSSLPRNIPTAPASFPRYITFREGELHEALHKLDAEGKYPLPDLSNTTTRDSSTVNSGNRRTRLIWNHECSVTFPDGREGTYRYTRGGLQEHLARYEYKRAESIELLPVQNVGEKLENTYPAIEAAAKENAAAAFAEAVVRERKDYFKRASENASRKARPPFYRCRYRPNSTLPGAYHRRRR